jgi:hypothetical protein
MERYGSTEQGGMRERYLEELADVAGAEDLVHAGEPVRLPGGEVGREDAPRRAPAPQHLARCARWRRRRRPTDAAMCVLAGRPPVRHRHDDVLHACSPQELSSPNLEEREGGYDGRSAPSARART